MQKTNKQKETQNKKKKMANMSCTTFLLRGANNTNDIKLVTNLRRKIVLYYSQSLMKNSKKCNLKNNKRQLKMCFA